MPLTTRSEWTLWDLLASAKFYFLASLGEASRARCHGTAVGRRQPCSFHKRGTSPHSLVAGLLVGCGRSLQSTWVGATGALSENLATCIQMGLGQGFGGKRQSEALHLHGLVTCAGEAGDGTKEPVSSTLPAGRQGRAWQ